MIQFGALPFILSISLISISLTQEKGDQDTPILPQDTTIVAAMADSIAANSTIVAVEADSLEPDNSLAISELEFTDEPGSMVFRSIKNKAFDIGEKLTFVIRYGPIKAGNAIMSIPDTVHVRGVPCYHIVSEAFSNKFFSSFYRVHDVAESHTDMKGIFSWHFEKHLREGKYKADRYVDFDHFNHVAVRGKDSLAVPPFVQDVLSALYFIRTQDLVVGQPISVDNYSDNKLYPLEVKVHKKERKRVRAGEFDCVVVEPILKAAGIFEHKGQLWVWLTDDERRIPVMMKSKILIGSIIAELEKIEGVKGR